MTEPTKPPRSCGTCSLCCKVLAIRELDKPTGVWCPNVRKGSGCGIYADRPSVCRDSDCLWLQSPDDAVPEEFKPERVRAVLWGNKADESSIIVHADPGYPTAFREGAFGAWLLSRERGLKIIVVCGDVVWTRLGKSWVRCKVVKHGDDIGTFDAYLEGEGR